MRVNLLVKSVFSIFSICCTVFLFAQEESVKLHFNPDRGFYEDNFDLTLSTTPEGLTIRYTMDGTDPSVSPTALTGTSPVVIHVDPANTDGRDRAPGFFVRAVAIQADTAATAVKTHTYIFADRVVELSPDHLKPGPGWIDENSSRWGSQNMNYGMDPQVCDNSLYKDKITDALLDIPSFSMVMDLKDLFDPQSGIYVNALEHGEEWERPCSVELIYPDGTDGFQINCGVRIRGGWSRINTNPKRAFRWFFRKEYGETKLEYPLFGDEGVDKFDHMDLRTAMNYSWSYGAEDPSKNTFLRDIWSRDLQRDMGQPYTRSRYYHLYINGTYWGLYQTQERAEASFAASYLGGEKEDYDVIKVNGGFQGLFVIETADGTMDAWQRLWEASMQGFETAEAYYRIQGCNPDGSRNPDYEVLLDVDNLIDFMITVFISGDGDGPASGFTNGPNNFYAVYNPKMERGFVYLRHDAEHTLGAQSWAVDRTGPFNIGGTLEKSNPQWFHQKLCENPLYVDRFANRVTKYFFNDGVMTPEANLNRMLDRKKTIELAIIAESARWGDSKREPAFTKDNGWIPAVNYILNSFLPTRTDVVLLQFIRQGWYPRVDPPGFCSKSGLVSKGFQLSMSTSRGTIYYTTDGTDPYLPVDVSTVYTDLVVENAPKKVMIPTGAIGASWNQSLLFDDSDWQSGTGNVGFEQDQGYEDRIGLDVGSEMMNQQPGCCVRIPFTVDGTVYNVLRFRVRYDDGFAAFLNGEKVAAANAPGSLTWNSSATDSHEDEGWETFDITDAVGHLLPGDNLLAIQAMNRSATSSDFIIGAELVAGVASNEGDIASGAAEYSQQVVIDQTTCVKARVYDNNTWSALNTVTFTVLEGLENLRITEIHYHPLDVGVTDNNDGEYEFLEFKNIGNESLDLSGVHFSRGLSYTFPEGASVDSGDFLVLASNDSAFFERYDFYPFGDYSGQLDNSGETIALNSAAGDTLFKIRYNDKYPWPASADGQGFSIIPKNPDPYQDPNDPDCWTASSVIHGTPGRDDIVVSVDKSPDAGMPADFRLMQNFPNPFNSSTTIQFQVSEPALVTLKIFNMLGQQVDEPVYRTFLPGHHSLTWDASGLSSGLYFYRLTTDDGVALTKKLVLIK
ncbi:CotH kinase family protein [bacterium]|nr:CotH kinase family protein [bacterium]